MMAQKEGINSSHFPFWITGSRNKSYSFCNSYWIIGFTAVIFLTCYCGSVEGFAPRKTLAKDPPGTWEDNKIEQDGADFADLISPDSYVREPRGASYVQRLDDQDIKHYDRIPVSRSQLETARKGTSPPPEEDEDDFESLEANREAFMELLDDHAKHPHRRRSFKHHGKLQLKYDHHTKRYAITEQESDEW